MLVRRVESEELSNIIKQGAGLLILVCDIVHQALVLPFFLHHYHLPYRTRLRLTRTQIYFSLMCCIIVLPGSCY